MLPPFGARTLMPVNVVAVLPVYVACIDSSMIRCPDEGKPVVEVTASVVEVSPVCAVLGVSPVPT